MVVHLCCSVDAGYFLKKLKEAYPQEKFTGYFYDPNIHPYSEFKLRSLDTKRICEKLNVEYVEGEYDYENWLTAVKGKETEPEKGSRCSVCFDHSLEATARFAKKRGENKITTSLLMSPMKSQEQLFLTGKAVKKKYGIDFLIVDYRKKGGTQKQQEFARENQLYRQDYCGCIYGIFKQKHNQEIIDELISPYPFQILPASIEERLSFYENRIKLEEKGISYKILKEGFLNYRVLQSAVKFKIQNGKWKNLIHYTLFYSYLQRKQRVRIEYVKNQTAYANRANIIFITVKKLNEILNKNYRQIRDFYLNPLTIDEEIKIREIVTKTPFNLSPILVLEEFTDKTLEVEINSKIYSDTREILI